MQKTYLDSEMKNGKRIDYEFAFTPNGQTAVRGKQTGLNMVNGNFIKNDAEFHVLNGQPFPAYIYGEKRSDPFIVGTGIRIK